MESFIQYISTFLILGGVAAIYKIMVVYFHFKKQRVNKGQRQNHYHILLPIYKENRRIKNTVQYFNKMFSAWIVAGRMSIYLISTAKEGGKNTSRTFRAAKQIESQNNHVKHVHYPLTNGYMAHQLNYCIREVYDSLDKNSIICVYNADSYPDKNTFSLLDKMDINKYDLVQQVGNYKKNYNGFGGNWFFKCILRSAALWQNRWSISVELYSYICRLHLASTYCIGHGLFFRKDVVKKIGFFSESTVTEDLLFGMKATMTGLRIRTLAVYDLSDSPDSVYGLYIQKKTWYYGPFQVLTQLPGTMLRQKIIIFRTFFYAIYWIVTPGLFFILFVYSILNWDYQFFIIAYFSYLILPNFMADILVTKQVDLRTMLINFIGGWVGHFMHGTSALGALLEIAKNKILNRTIIKEKTPVKNDI